MSLRIAIDASRATAVQPTGTETYALRLIHALILANEGLAQPFHFRLYFRDNPPAGLFSSLQACRASRHPAATIIGRIFAWLRRSGGGGTTCCFVPAHTLPFVFPGKAIVTAHDLGYKHFPGAHRIRQRLYLNTTTRYSQARATIVLADSHATADDLARFYATPRHKIRVVYPGVEAAPLDRKARRDSGCAQKIPIAATLFSVLGHLAAAQEYRATPCGHSRSRKLRQATKKRRSCWRAGAAGSSMNAGWTARATCGKSAT